MPLTDSLEGWDQQHAKAVEMLRTSKSFILLSFDDGGMQSTMGLDLVGLDLEDLVFAYEALEKVRLQLGIEIAVEKVASVIRRSRGFDAQG